MRMKKITKDEKKLLVAEDYYGSPDTQSVYLMSELKEDNDGAEGTYKVYKYVGRVEIKLEKKLKVVKIKD